MNVTVYGLMLLLSFEYHWNNLANAFGRGTLG